MGMRAMIPLTGQDTLAVSPTSVDRNSKNAVLSAHGEGLIRHLNTLDNDTSAALMEYKALDAALCEQVVVEIASREYMVDNIEQGKNLDHAWLAAGQAPEKNYDSGNLDVW
jgi:hypothetical protein